MKEGRGFLAPELPKHQIETIEEKANLARGDIITMTTLAGSGHPGGSMSSIDIYLTLYASANIDSSDPHSPDRDRIIVSHGHTSPAVYSALAHNGFIDRDEMICGFRQPWSIFEGHIERDVPGVEWSTGNLGQGLSAGCGMALASRLTGHSFNVFVCMGDGEQQKGQIAEARRFAVKYQLNNLTAIIDYNRLQISGKIHDVMPQNIVAGWESDGWEVLKIDGHSIPQIHDALHRAVMAEHPVCIIANTIMGKGVPFMENQHKYHGAPVKSDQYAEAMSALGRPEKHLFYKALRPEIKERTKRTELPRIELKVDKGEPRTYGTDSKTDNRSAWGNALKDLGQRHHKNPSLSPIAVFDCDLGPSVKTGGFESTHPEHFFQVGIQEHHTATMAGALSTQGVLTFWADFGVFGVDEAYNQQRLNDINYSNLKVACTHIGLDVGEDGKTHQCIDYIGLMRNLYDFKVLLPADPNETDRITRWAAETSSNVFIGMGRSKLPTLCLEDGSPAFAGDFTFEYGKGVLLREGRDLTILSTGTMTHRAVEAWEILKDKGISARVVHVSSPTEIDREMLASAAETGLIITYEDHNPNTGLGASVALALVDGGLASKLIRLGVSSYQPSGPSSEVFAHAGLDVDGLVDVCLKASSHP